MKPKTMIVGDVNESHTRDQCQTPWYALKPLLPYLPKDRIIWEPAAGEGYLQKELAKAGYTVVSGDILTGQNFFDINFDSLNPIQVTNPPYSIAEEWTTRSYELGHPFALLMAVDVLGNKWAQSLFDQYGVEILCLNRRIDFKMPEKGWKGSAQFTTFWYTQGLNIGAQLTFVNLRKPSKQRVSEWALGYEQLELFA